MTFPEYTDHNNSACTLKLFCLIEKSEAFTKCFDTIIVDYWLVIVKISYDSLVNFTYNVKHLNSVIIISKLISPNYCLYSKIS